MIFFEERERETHVPPDENFENVFSIDINEEIY